MPKTPRTADLRLAHSGPAGASDLAVLYETYGSKVVNFIRQRTLGMDEDPEDIAQEVFAKIAQRQELLDDISQGNVNRLPYLFSMANNLVIDLRRRQKLRHSHLQSEERQQTAEDGVAQDSPEDVAVMGNQLDSYKRTLASIKPAWRQAFLLHRFKYLTYREIAEKMDVSSKQAEYFVTQAVVKLKETKARLDRAGEK